MKWCAEDLRPFEIVDDRGFRDIAQDLVQLVADVLPSSRTVSRITTAEYQEIMKEVVKEVSCAIIEGNIYHFLNLKYYVHIIIINIYLDLTLISIVNFIRKLIHHHRYVAGSL